MLKFKDLCTQLNLNKDYADEKQLNALEQWCIEYISTECKSFDSNKEKYATYLQCAQEYLDDFLPTLPLNLTEPLPHFNGMNAIQYAAYQGYDRFLSQLVQPIDAGLFNGESLSAMPPLHLAALKGHLNTVKILLSLGASASEYNRHHQLPIYCSLILPMAQDESMKMAKTDIFFLLKNLDPSAINGIDSNGETLAHAMVVNGFDELLNELVEHHNVVFHANNYGKYPIHTAILNAQLNATRTLLSLPGMVDVVDTERRTPLHYAAKHADEHSIDACCDNNATLDAQDMYQMTPLLLAAEAGQLANVKSLIEKGADPLIKDYRGYTLLHHAVNSANFKLVSWILNTLPVEVNALDNDEHTPLDYIKNDLKYEEIEGILKSKGGHSSTEMK